MYFGVVYLAYDRVPNKNDGLKIFFLFLSSSCFPNEQKLREDMLRSLNTLILVVGGNGQNFVYVQTT